MLGHILLEILLTAVLLVILFFLSKFIFWKDIKEIIRLNQEAVHGNPEPEKLVAVYLRTIKKIVIWIIFLSGLVILMRRSGITSQ